MAERSVEIDFETITLSKIDVAKSQLCEAIMLFFERRDPVSVHTLANAAHEILQKEYKKLNGDYPDFTFRAIVKDEIKDGAKKRVLNEFYKDKNFMKHGGETSIVFNTAKNEVLLFEAMAYFCGLYPDLGGSEPEIRTFFGWFGLTYPELLADWFKNSESYLYLTGLVNDLDVDDFSLCVQLINHEKGVRCD